MDNLKNIIDEKLWNFIKRNYNSENYTSSVLDSIQFIGDLIREKSGLETDGNNLIGQAFGGKNPKIKLNKLQTETDQNIQKGVESTLRGIYSAFRNPRSHTKFEDKEEDADAIILFLNHLLKLIDKSKGKFSIESFIVRIEDKDFVNNDKYVDLLIDNIPKQKYFDTAFELFKSKENGSINNLRLIFGKLTKKLKDEESNEILDAASEELRYTESDSLVMKNIALFKDKWTEIDEDAKLRAENKMLNCLKDAQYYDDQLNSEAINSSWLSDIINSLSLRNEFSSIIYEKLQSGDKEQQRFIVKYFGEIIEDFHEPMFNNLSDILNEQLKNGNSVIYNFVKNYISSDEIKKEIEDEFNKFVDSNTIDDLPF